VRGAHPGFDSAERVLDCAAMQGHRAGVAAQILTHFVGQMLILPAGDPGFLAAAALSLQGAMLAHLDPVLRHRLATFFPASATDQSVVCGANIYILRRLAEEPVPSRAYP